MLRSWLLMASVLCVFMTSGCGKNETPVAANTPPAASAPPSTPSNYGGGESSESSEAGGSIPPGGSDSYGDGSSANSGGGYGGNQGNVGYPGSSAGYPGNSAGYPGNSAGYPGGGMAGSEGEPGYGAGYPGGANQGYGGPNQGQAGMQGQMGGNRGAARPNTPPPKPKKLTPKERATIAFEAGNMTRAYSLYHAHALSGDETQASEISDEMRWAARRPQIGLKVAVGLALKNPANVASGSLRPLGTDYQTIMGPLAGAAGGGRGMGGGPGAGGGDELGMGGMVSSGGPGFNGPGSGMGTPDGSPLKAGRAKALSDAAGTLAEKVIESFRDELSSGAFTVAFKDYPMTSRPGAKFLKGFGPNTGAPGMGNGMGYPGGEGMGYPGGDGMGYPGGDGMGYPGGAGSDNPGYGAANSGYGAANSGYGGGMSTDGGSAPPGVPGGVRGGRQFFHFPQDEVGMPSRPSMPTAGTGSTAAPGRPTLGAPQGGGGVPGPMSGQDAAGQGFSGESGQGMEGQGFEGQGYGTPGYGGPGYGGQGAGGQGFPGQGLGQNGPNQLPPPPNISKEVRPPEGVTPLAACLHYIGSDEQSKLIKKAYDEGYDALLVFEVVINQNRQTTVVNNATRVKAIFPAETQKDAKVIASSKELVNVTVARANTKNENDGVEDAANLLVKKLVEAIALKEIPDKLTPEAVTGNRIPKLLKEEGLSKLEKLGEINFYYCKGFIDETQRDELYTKIAGKLAAQLMTGSEEEKEEALDELLGD